MSDAETPAERAARVETTAGISQPLVESLVRAQFPQWADLPVRPSSQQGHDNRTYRLGEELSVRLPASDAHAVGTAKEHQVLPLVSGRLSVATPELVGVGVPGEGFARPWSVLRWLPGQTPGSVSGLDTRRFAADLGGVLRELRGVPTEGGPWAGLHSFRRGAHPSVYADQVQQELQSGRFDAVRDQVLRIWRAGMASAWPHEPVWFHGDVAEGNVLVRDGVLAALIDWGTSGVGDPACDLVIAWTFFDHSDRRVFADAVQLDADTWARARAWALWKALITLGTWQADPQRPTQERAFAALLDDPVVT